MEELAFSVYYWGLACFGVIAGVNLVFYGQLKNMLKRRKMI